MQFGCAMHDAALDISDDRGAIAGAFGGIALYETVVHEAIEAVMTALRIEPQQMIAQQRQLFLLAQRPNVALGQRRTGNVFVSHVKSPLGWPSRRRRIPRRRILCIAPWNSRPLPALNNGRKSRLVG